jgi:hypothetical protein
MITHLLRHQWFQFKRSPSYQRELGLAIFIWILAFLAFVSFLALAIALPKIVGKIEGVTDPVVFINRALIYFFMSELFMRYFLQQVPALDILPYLGLPIKRNQVSAFLLGKSMLSIFNILSLVLTVPFAVQILAPTFGPAATTGWLISIFSITLCLHFVNILFKKKLEDLPVVWVILIVLVASNWLMGYYFQFDLFNPLASALTSILHYPAFALAPFALALLLLYVSIRFFNENLYIEEIRNDARHHVENFSEKLGFLGRSSLANTLSLQEIKLIIRHKRTRSVLLISVLFVAYGLIFFGREKGSSAMHVFVGVFMSGLFTINYGQFFWSWNTNQLDFFLTKPIALDTWLRSRYKILAATSIASTLLAVPYVHFGWEVLLAILAGCVYNLGINIPLMMRMSMWSPRAIDLNKGAFMNYEGTGAAQWVMGLPVMAGPYLFYIPVNLMVGHVGGLCSVAFFGLLGFALRDQFMRLILQKFRTAKYKLIQDLTL